MKTKKLDYVIYYHDCDDEEINQCFGNCKLFKVKAHNCLQAIKEFYKEPGNELPIYDISVGNIVSLGYVATQSLLRLEGYIDVLDSRLDRLEKA